MITEQTIIFASWVDSNEDVNVPTNTLQAQQTHPELPTTHKRLREVERIYEEGLISIEEYTATRSRILEAL